LWQVKLNGTVLNKGWSIEHVDYKDDSIPEKIRIRGFKIEKIEQLAAN
jgi:UDP-sugar pyrophosphorylase